MDFARRHQPHAAIKSAEHRKVATQWSNVGVPAVVDPHDENILARNQIGREIKAETGKAAIVPTDRAAVQPHLRRQRSAIEFDEGPRRRVDFFEEQAAAVPGRTAIKVLTCIARGGIIGVR